MRESHDRQVVEQSYSEGQMTELTDEESGNYLKALRQSFAGARAQEAIAQALLDLLEGQVDPADHMSFLEDRVKAHMRRAKRWRKRQSSLPSDATIGSPTYRHKDNRIKQTEFGDLVETRTPLRHTAARETLRHIPRDLLDYEL